MFYFQGGTAIAEYSANTLFVYLQRLPKRCPMAKTRVGSSKGKGDARYMAVMAKLAERRQSLGLTQTALAGRLAAHQQFVCRYETGQRRLDIVELVDVAKALELNASDLLAAI